MPPSWFKDASADEQALLGGPASSGAFIYALNAYAKAQTRLQTTMDGFLDLAAWDLFGVRFGRLPSESDAAFLARILLEIKRERATRNGIIQAVKDLTGIAPILIEPSNPADTWAWDLSYWDVNNLGSTDLRNQIFITAYRPAGGGIANWPGWDFAYWDANYYWVDQSMVAAPVSDAQIYAQIAATVAAGVTAWVQILNPPVTGDSIIFAQLRSGLLVDLGGIITGASISDDLGLVTGIISASLDLGAAVNADSPIFAQLRSGSPVDLGMVIDAVSLSDDFGIAGTAVSSTLDLGTAP